MSKYRFARYDASMFEAVCQLRSDVFGGSLEDNLAYMRWKYLDNPYLDEPILHVVFDGDRLVAMRGCYGAAWMIPNRPTPWVMPAVGEVAVAEEYRRTRAFLGLKDFSNDDLAERGFTVGIGLSATPLSRRMGERDRWHFVSPYRMVRRSERRSLVERGSVRVLGRKGRLPIDRLESALHRGERSLVRLSTEDASERCTDEAGPHGIHHVRDDAFFAWRFDNPLMRYLVVGTARNDACIVVQTVGGGTFSVIDWAGDAESVLALIADVTAVSGGVRMQTWSSWLPDDLVRGLGDAGFSLAEDESERGLMVRGHTDESDLIVDGHDLSDADAWGIRMVASDRF